MRKTVRILFNVLLFWPADELPVAGSYYDLGWTLDSPTSDIFGDHGARDDDSQHSDAFNVRVDTDSALSLVNVLSLCSAMSRPPTHSTTS